MNNYVNASELKSTDWLAIVECDGPDQMGAVLGFLVGDSEDQVSNIPRGELLDALELFITEEVPDDVSVEYMTVQDFYESYGNRMPLGTNGVRY